MRGCLRTQVQFPCFPVCLLLFLSCFSSVCITFILVGLFACSNFLLRNLPGCGSQSLKLIHLPKISAMSAQICLPGWAPLSFCSSLGHLKVPGRVSRAGWICWRSEHGCMCLASPGARAVEVLTRETNTTSFNSMFLCHCSAAKDCALFPNSPPLAPNTALPCCQVSTLLPRTFAWWWR